MLPGVKATTRYGPEPTGFRANSSARALSSAPSDWKYPWGTTKPARKPSQRGNEGSNRSKTSWSVALSRTWYSLTRAYVAL